MPGSLTIIVFCRSLETLDTLWLDYCTGLLNEEVQRCFVTEEILEEFGITELGLKTTIAEEEYRACRQYFLTDFGRLKS